MSSLVVPVLLLAACLLAALLALAVIGLRVRRSGALPARLALVTGYRLPRLLGSGALRPLRVGLRRMLGKRRYERARLAVWARTKKAARFDPLHPDILPLIDTLEGDGRLMAGAAPRLRGVARGIRAEFRQAPPAESSQGRAGEECASATT